MCARIGLATGDGIAGIMRKKYSKKVLFPLVSLLLIANTINIGSGKAEPTIAVDTRKYIQVT